ncbi:MAG: GntR family transcriptional regulator [Candidatus Rokubacteria bacterium]|nr:GntR family transcriptional regulator [Candidatus Rokubacteria bacterium]
MVPPIRPLPPLYYRVFKTLEKRIQDRHYGLGERLPSEDALCRDFGVSRMTIRQALAGLVDAGLLTRRRGSGSYVSATGARRVSAQMKLTGALEDLFAEVGSARVDTARLAEAPPPPEVQGLMGLGDGEPVTVIHRVRAIEGQRFALTVNYLPVALGRRIAEPDLYRLPLLQVLEEKLGGRFQHARQTVEARLADAEVAAALGLEFGDPVLFVERLMFGRGPRPIEVVRSHYRADVYRYQIMLVRSSRAGFRWRRATRAARRTPERRPRERQTWQR